MVEISIARYEELLAAERDATVLKNFIAYKDKRFQDVTHAEVSLLNELFCSENTEDEK